MAACTFFGLTVFPTLEGSSTRMCYSHGVMWRAHLKLALVVVVTTAACTEARETEVRVHRVPNPPAYRVSDVVELSEVGRLLRLSQERELTPALRLVRYRPGFALVLRDVSAEEAEALAARLDGVAIETERRAGATLVRLRTTRPFEGPVALPTGTLVVSLDPVPRELEAPSDREALWAQASDRVATWIDADALEETERCIPASSARSEHSLVPASFDPVTLWVALDDGRVAGVAHDAFADQTHVSVHGVEAGCTLADGSLFTKAGPLRDLSVDEGEVVLTSPDGSSVRWSPQPGVNLSD